MVLIFNLINRSTNHKEKELHLLNKILIYTRNSYPTVREKKLINYELRRFN